MTSDVDVAKIVYIHILSCNLKKKKKVMQTYISVVFILLQQIMQFHIELLGLEQIIVILILK